MAKSMTTGVVSHSLNQLVVMTDFEVRKVFVVWTGYQEVFIVYNSQQIAPTT